MSLKVHVSLYSPFYVIVFILFVVQFNRDFFASFFFVFSFKLVNILRMLSHVCAPNWWADVGILVSTWILIYCSHIQWWPSLLVDWLIDISCHDAFVHWFDYHINQSNSASGQISWPSEKQQDTSTSVNEVIQLWLAITRTHGKWTFPLPLANLNVHQKRVCVLFRVVSICPSFDVNVNFSDSRSFCSPPVFLPVYSLSSASLHSVALRRLNRNTIAISHAESKNWTDRKWWSFDSVARFVCPNTFLLDLSSSNSTPNLQIQTASGNCQRLVSFRHFVGAWIAWLFRIVIELPGSLHPKATSSLCFHFEINCARRQYEQHNQQQRRARPLRLLCFFRALFVHSPVVACRPSYFNQPAATDAIGLIVPDTSKHCNRSQDKRPSAK